MSCSRKILLSQATSNENYKLESESNYYNYEPTFKRTY